MRRRMTFGSWLLIVGLIVLFSNHSIKSADVLGYVKDSQTGLPISGATVIINEVSDTTLTNSEGQYFFPGIPDGAYTFIIGGQNYQTYSMFPVNVGTCCVGLRGNADGDVNDNVNVADLVYLVDFLFKGGEPLPCLEEGDVIVNGNILVDDLVYMVNYLFKGGPPPASC